MKIMKATELTTRHRIMILEDVLKKLESGDKKGGLCYKIRHSAFELFKIWESDAENIIPILTFKNARKITNVASWASKFGYWWNFELFYSEIKIRDYDFENRIKFVNWMIEQEKEFLK